MFPFQGRTKALEFSWSHERMQVATATRERVVYPGYTPFAEEVIRHLGANIQPAQLGSIGVFTDSCSLISQAMHRSDLSDSQRSEVLNVARGRLEILHAAFLTLQASIDFAESAFTEPEPESKPRPKSR